MGEYQLVACVGYSAGHCRASSREDECMVDKYLVPTVKLTLEVRLSTLNRRRLPPFLLRLCCFTIVRRWRPAGESGARDVLTDLPSDVAESREVHAEFSSGT